MLFLPPATKLRQGNVLPSMCQEFCPRGRVSVPACTTGQMTRRSLCPGGSLSGRRRSVSRGSLSSGSLSREGLCPGGSLSSRASVRETPPTESPCTVMNGWYASYWNAFLCVISQVRRQFSVVDPGLPRGNGTNLLFG